MRKLRLIADDLTGALDSGCAFASEHSPVLIGLPWQPLPRGPRIAISTETRNCDPPAGEAAVADAVHHLMIDEDSDTLWLKKIDSVMRGNPVGETLAAYRAGGFDHCVFAPAFPEMGRITEGGRQYLLIEKTGERTGVGPDLITAFRSHGLTAELRGFAEDGDVLPGRNPANDISLIDAATQQELLFRVAGLARRIAGRPLWVGTGGLAAALSGKRSTISFPRVHALIVGTRHSVTLAQIEHARDAAAVSHYDKNRITLSSPMLIAPSLASASAAETHEVLRSTIPRIEIADPARSAIFVTGGDTLSTVLQAVEAEFLECIGEATAGVPICRVQGGYWAGVTILSKSGGFGQESLLTELLAR